MVDVLGDLLAAQLLTLNFSRPLTYLDLGLAITIVVALLMYMRRFPAFRVVLGTLLLLSVAIICFLSGFILTGLVFGFMSGLILISLPLIFAPEIRHYLEKIGRLHFLLKPFLEKGRQEVFIRNLVGSVFELAERHIGALVIIQRKTGLGGLIDSGIVINGRFGSKLLESIFYPNSPLHDGAVVVGEGKIIAARCTVKTDPLVKLDPPFGQRHKAGLSATRYTDAIAIIVSEQRGEVSLAENGKLDLNLSRAALTERLTKLL